jgi:immune inhibitor A
VLPDEYDADGTKIYAYLTIPEDAKLGVTAHEMGHLLFGFPDLYDIDYTSEGVGNWCLMAGGSWNGGGDTPAHPSAWCKAQQGWVDVDNVTTDSTLTLADVKTSRTVHRLWTDGADGQEYFLLENRQLAGFDAELPGAGLLIWHVDDSRETNEDENHYLVGLVQADGSRDLELGMNRGDGGDPFPGWSANTLFTGTSTPASTGYSGQDSLVAVTGISDSDETMTASVSVHSAGDRPSDDVERRLAALEARVSTLEDAVAGASSALSGIRPGGAGMAGSRRSRTAGGALSAGAGADGGDPFTAGIAAAGRAFRDLLGEMQHPWSPRRRT